MSKCGSRQGGVGWPRRGAHFLIHSFHMNSANIRYIHFVYLRVYRSLFAVGIWGFVYRRVHGMAIMISREKENIRTRAKYPAASLSIFPALSLLSLFVVMKVRWLTINKPLSFSNTLPLHPQPLSPSFFRSLISKRIDNTIIRNIFDSFNLI